MDDPDELELATLEEDLEIVMLDDDDGFEVVLDNVVDGEVDSDDELEDDDFEVDPVLDADVVEIELVPVEAADLIEVANPEETELGWELATEDDRIDPDEVKIEDEVDEVLLNVDVSLDEEDVLLSGAAACTNFAKANLAFGAATVTWVYSVNLDGPPQISSEFPIHRSLHWLSAAACMAPEASVSPHLLKLDLKKQKWLWGLTSIPDGIPNLHMYMKNTQTGMFQRSFGHLRELGLTMHDQQLAQHSNRYN